MPDIFDQAQETNELFTANALAEHLKKRRAGTPWTPHTNCADCGEPIPKNRLKANPQATRCITCQALAERRGFEDE